jgi:hypothetical protein
MEDFGAEVLDEAVERIRFTRRERPRQAGFGFDIQTRL